jgi:hypothetical protein
VLQAALLVVSVAEISRMRLRGRAAKKAS